MKKSILILLSAVFCAVLSAQLPDKPLLKVFDAAYRKTPLENVLFSPWGIQECFGMVYAGAGEKAANELDKTLGINGQLAPELRQAREFFTQDNAKFNSFNAVIFDRKYSLQDKFISTVGNQYNGKLYLADFKRSAEVADTLNNIVKKESSGMFDKVFDENMLAGDPAVILMNVLYFKGAWALTFEKYATQKENFDTPSASNMVDMMNSERHLPYYNDGKIHGIILDYKNSSFKMLVLTAVDKTLPLSTVTGALAEKGITHFITNSSSRNETVIKLPKLKVESKLDLKKLFVPLGREVLFNSNAGDLTGMVKDSTLYIDEAEQLVKLNLDEAGSEVAAVTYAMAKMLAAPPIKKIQNHFYADHPFVLVLFDSKSNAILLAAAIIDPS